MAIAKPQHLQYAGKQRMEIKTLKFVPRVKEGSKFLLGLNVT